MPEYNWIYLKTTIPHKLTVSPNKLYSSHREKKEGTSMCIPTYFQFYHGN